MGAAPAIVSGAVALVACTANWWSRWRGDRRVELVSKPFATIALGALALAVADDSSTGARVAAVVAFVLCVGGDVALLPAVDSFLVGLGSFLAGHVAFVVMFVLLGLDRPALGAIAAGAFAIVGVTVGRRIVGGAERALKVPVQAYLAVIGAMAIVGWMTGRPAAIVGASLFVVSDSILGWGRFVAERRWMPVGIMVTYHGALAGLALSLR